MSLLHLQPGPALAASREGHLHVVSVSIVCRSVRGPGQAGLGQPLLQSVLGVDSCASFAKEWECVCCVARM